MDLRVAITGHVDHGKSTLIGRLLYDTGSLADGKAEEILASSERRGLAVEWSFAVDAAQEERDQAITIETTRVWMHYGGRRIVIIDTPGHREFIRNMMSGAADADAGILVDRRARRDRRSDLPPRLPAALARRPRDHRRGQQDRRGRRSAGAFRADQPRHPLGAGDGRQAAARDRSGFGARRRQRRQPLGAHGLVRRPDADRRAASRCIRSRRRPTARCASTSRTSTGSATKSASRSATSWPAESSPRRPRADRPQRRDHARARDQTLARDPSPALAGQAVGLTFEDPVFIDRGDVVTHADRPPFPATSAFDGVFFWLSADGPPRVGETLQFNIGRPKSRVTIVGIDETIDLGILDKVAPDDSPTHSAFALRLRAARSVAAEAGARCVLLRNGEVVGGGKLSTSRRPRRRTDNLVPQGHLIPSESARAAQRLSRPRRVAHRSAGQRQVDDRDGGRTRAVRARLFRLRPRRRQRPRRAQPRPRLHPRGAPGEHSARRARSPRCSPMPARS